MNKIGIKVFCLLGYNTMYSGESQPTFRREICPPSSALKNKPNKNQTWNRQQASSVYFMLVSCLAHSLTLKVEVMCSSKKLVDFHSTPPPWHYSPGWALAFFKRVFHSPRLAAITFHPLHPTLAVSSSICPSHLNLGLPRGHLPPGCSISTFFAGSFSLIRITWPAHHSLHNFTNLTMSSSWYN
jgi:hypothetical protein